MSAAFLLASAGCDTDPARLVRDIDAAREGCTDEMLAAGAEECVQMFERYIDMGTEAMRRYVGAMRSLDAALDRRGSVMFDTAGLGHAISPDSVGIYPPAVADWRRTLRDRASPMDSGYRAPDSRTDGYGSRAIDEGIQPTAGYDVPPAPGPEPNPSRAGRPEMTDPAAGEPIRENAGRVPAPRPGERRRGVLLPPEERLQRPWIGGEEPADEYYPERAAPAGMDGSSNPPETRRPVSPYDDLPR